ncbi:MAG: hypothetical protein Q8N84_03545 [bacterium]|nr:hypothetical protein [bacterium]
MEVEPLRKDLAAILKRHALEKKYSKQERLFEQNPFHPSLHTEKLEPKTLNIFSFRLDKQWRAIFIVLESGKAEIVAVTPHYE